MKLNPHKRWELALRVATSRGDVATIQLALDALRRLDPDATHTQERPRRHAA